MTAGRRAALYRYNHSAKGRARLARYSGTSRDRERIARFEAKPERTEQKRWSRKSLRLHNRIQENSI